MSKSKVIKDMGQGGAMKKLVLLVMVLGCVWFGMGTSYAVGLRTPLGQLAVSGLKIGKSYSLKALINRTYELINTGDEPLDVGIASEKPTSGEIIPGCEPVPDTKWVSLEKTRFVIGPSQVAKTDVVVTIPNEERYLGKKYLVVLASRTQGNAPIQIGLRSRLVLEVSSTPPSVDELRQKLSKPKYKNLSFDVSPYETVVEDFPLGREVDLLKEKNVKLKVINPNDEECSSCRETVWL
jgi:hypothetical protein